MAKAQLVVLSCIGAVVLQGASAFVIFGIKFWIGDFLRRSSMITTPSTLLSPDANEANKQCAAHNLRNQEPILQMLQKYLPAEAGQAKSQYNVLEIGSGTGQHAVYMPEHLTGLVWQPSDYDESYATSVAAWTHGMPNVKPWIRLDASASPEQWPVEASWFDCVYNCNTVHIAPIAVLDGLVPGAARCLKKGGKLVTYGPYKLNGRHTAESNADFDASLRARNPEWGIRDFEEVNQRALSSGFVLEGREDMPSNNFLCVWRKQ